jgi:dTDP-4-amino-4,6-dideoxygalactose transaminase
MASTLTILDPIAPPQHAARALTVLDTLAGKTVGFIDNAKPNFNFLVEDLAAEFTQKHSVKAIVTRRKRGASIPADESMIREIAERCDIVITGSGD